MSYSVIDGLVNYFNDDDDDDDDYSRYSCLDDERLSVKMSENIL